MTGGLCVVVLLVNLALLIYLDLITTKYALEAGLGIEGNPVSAMLLNLGLLEDIKISVSVVLCLLAVVVYVRKDAVERVASRLLFKFVSTLLQFVTLTYIVIVTSNLLVLVAKGDIIYLVIGFLAGN